jgi:ABC-2 type transport system ATP-binding protein
MSRPENQQIVLNHVSKFYGEVLGVNDVTLALDPGITSLVGPNGSGKSTLMNLMTGLLQPTEGEISILGIPTSHPEQLQRNMGYCTQFDTFPVGMTGWDFVYKYLRLHGLDDARTRQMAEAAVERVGLSDAVGRKVAGYSKGMRQRIKLAQSIAHNPHVLILDEPLNGLDPLARSEVISLFKDWADEGLHLILSSHILHEIDLLSDNVVLLKQGYVVAEGKIREVRSEIRSMPMKILVRCDRIADLCARLVHLEHMTRVEFLDDRSGAMFSTRDAEAFYNDLTQAIVEDNHVVEMLAPADEDVEALYQYLIGEEDEA